MLDFHTHPANWGIKPVLFNIGNVPVTSYAFFVILGLIAGLLVYYYLAKKEKLHSENSFYVLVAGLCGGILGAKIPIWILNFPLLLQTNNVALFLSGRTIIGGLIGGTIAVIIVKKVLKINQKLGNLFAPAIALGVAIGRIGCFFAGCCYGTPTTLPWGVDFGDGLLRHPTQIYESIFMFGMFIFLIIKQNKNTKQKKSKEIKPGYLFYILMNFYFVFRFFEEFIRDNPRYFYLTLFQYLSIAALLFINGKYLFENRKKGNLENMQVQTRSMEKNIKRKRKSK
ncbi:MAG: prolipoprotein diacylglyceryl transferase family protein [Candidatus Woesearchaeota archaeon]|jgi:phosphatidylglycerol:prolipoprotein diacylglycerol transferase